MYSLHDIAEMLLMLMLVKTTINLLSDINISVAMFNRHTYIHMHFEG